MNAVRELERDGLTIAYALDDLPIRVEDSVAWVTYRNRGVLSGPGGADTLRWVESAVFRRSQDAWTVALLHTTHVRPEV